MKSEKIIPFSFTEAAFLKCSTNKVFLKFLQNSLENTCSFSVPSDPSFLQTLNIFASQIYTNLPFVIMIINIPVFQMFQHGIIVPWFQITFS